MSNCIEVLSPPIIIPLKMVNPAFIDLMQAANALKSSPGEGDLDMAWWFASSNVTFFHDRLLGDLMLVDLNGGRSSHTFRSLKALSIFFRKFLTGNLYFNLKVRDVDNNYTVTERYTFSGQLPRLAESEFWAKELKRLYWKRGEKDLLWALENARFDYEIVENLAARDQAIKLDALRGPVTVKVVSHS